MSEPKTFVCADCWCDAPWTEGCDDEGAEWCDACWARIQRVWRTADSESRSANEATPDLDTSGKGSGS